MGNADKFDMQTMDFYLQVEEQWRITQSLSHLFPQQIEARRMFRLLCHRNSFIQEANATYMESMFKAKTVLEKYLQPEIILSTVDLVLYRLMQGDIRGIRGKLVNYIILLHLVTSRCCHRLRRGEREREILSTYLSTFVLKYAATRGKKIKF